MTIGIRDAGSVTTTVDKVTACVPEHVQDECTGGGRPSPAAAAGLRAGDRVISFNGVRVADWAELRKAIGAAKPGQTVSVVVQRPGTSQPLTLPMRSALTGIISLAPML